MSFRLLIAAGSLASIVTGAQVALPGHHLAASPRRAMSLDSGWRFRLGSVGRPIGRDVDDSGWALINVPHTWNRVGFYGETRDPRTDASTGAGWYRLRFATPLRKPDEHSFVQFDGVGTIAEVWLNGRRLGEHRGAFGRFRFDVTDSLSTDGPNLLVVRVDNSERKEGSPTGDIIPLSGDFFIFGGIYRQVSLITTSATHIDLMDHGGPGVYANTRAIAPRQADVDVRVRVVRSGEPSMLSVMLDDKHGQPVAKSVRAIGPAGPEEVPIALRVASAHLWNGRRDPYRYRLRVELSRGHRLLDRVTMPFGIRRFTIDPDKGFLLNGRPLALHGVSRHQDRLGKGWALDTSDHREDMAIIEELGANTVRMAHYQHAPEWFELADMAGMVAWAEIPFVNQVAWRDVDASPALVANAREQLIELIRQNFNRASIVTWSIGNEVDIHARGEKWGNHSRKLLDELNRLAHHEDPTRPTTFADCCEASLQPERDAGREMLAGAADMIGYNRYFGWYYGKPDDLGPALDILHRRHPSLPISVSEYGAGAAVSQHSDDPRGGPVAEHGRPQPEEYQSWIIEQAWPAIAKRRYLWSSWLWNMFDFTTTTRSEGDATDINTKGLVTADRKTRKDAFYYLQANWSDRPVLHLNGSRYVDRAYPVTDVRAYSNADRVALMVNGRELGTRPCPGRICVWPAVHLQKGTNIITASANIAARHVSDEVRWQAPDPSLGLAIDAGALVGGERNGHRFGSDAFFEGGKTVALKDDEVRAPTSDDRAVARSVRVGTFRYRLPLPNGRWRLTLWLLDPDKASSGGSFSVLADGRVALRHVDLARLSGGTRTLIKRVLPVTVQNGAVTLDFRAGNAPASLAALVAEPANSSPRS